jgi:mRNA-degrading endonuclease RelE of RelBE toxin-antitoxin system
VATRKKGEGGKGAAAPRRAGAPKPALPDPSGDAPLHELTRDALSVLLYVVLLPEETRALVKQLRLSVPGFRTDALSDVERCDVLADEIRAAPETRAVVIDALRAAFRAPPLAKVGLDADAIEDLLDVGVSEHGLTLSLWRVLADPDAALRARAVPILERLVEEYYGPREPGAKGEAVAAPAEDSAEEKAKRRATKLERELTELRGHLEEERRKGEDARRRADELREKLQAQLKEARAREAHAVDDAARARESASDAARARERAETALAAAQATDAAAAAQRARAAEREATAKIAGLEARLARLVAREEELESALEAARARPEAERAAPASASSEGQADESEEVPASWLMPVYTREFYDSLEGWDRRILRAAFKQAQLLAQDHRHPSLRALPLEGLPGYYRVRVATDVRLLYRRTERQNTVEILSLIDREDLDRYIKQAKSR